MKKKVIKNKFRDISNYKLLDLYEYKIEGGNAEQSETLYENSYSKYEIREEILKRMYEYEDI